MKGQVSSWAVVQNHIKILRSLEGVVQLDDKWVRRQLKDISLSDCVAKVIVLYQESLLENLHGELLRLGLILFLDLEDFAKGSLTKYLNNVE